MGVSASDVTRGRAYGIARTMRMQAAWEGKDNHTRHVENQIAYADAVAEAAFERMKAFQPKFKDGKVIIDDTAPVLIYPTSHKLYQTYSTPYSELMRHMLDEMETGKNVVIVLGYKYGDDHINEILYKALENPNNIFYFFLYNPAEKGDFIDQLKRLADSMPNINIMTGKVLADFKTFVKYMLPATPEKTDQEKAIELLQKVLVGHADK